MITAAPPLPESAAAVRAGATNARVHSARRRWFAASLCAALALNLAAIGAFAATSMRWQAPSAGSSRTSWIIATSVAPAPERPAPNEVPERTVHPTEPGDRLQPTRQHTAHEPKTRLQAPPASPAVEGEPTRFFTSGEVDRPAEPDPDWNLDPAALDAVGVQKIVFDIFIGPTGEVIGCEIIEPRSLPEEARLALQERLKQTVLQPARRHDMAVASVRRIEVSVASPGS